MANDILTFEEYKKKFDNKKMLDLADDVGDKTLSSPEIIEIIQGYIDSAADLVKSYLKEFYTNETIISQDMVVQLVTQFTVYNQYSRRSNWPDGVLDAYDRNISRLEDLTKEIKAHLKDGRDARIGPGVSQPDKTTNWFGFNDDGSQKIDMWKGN